MHEFNEAWEGLLNKFPTTEQQSKGIKETNWSATIFVPRIVGSMKEINVPKNAESFSDSLFFLATLRLLDHEGYVIKKSETEMNVAVLKTTDGEKFAGWVNAHIHRQIDGRVQGSSKWSKGILAYQSEAVRRKLGSSNVDHLKLDDSSPGKWLSAMDGFSKEFWGTRSHLAQIYKDVVYSENVQQLNTFLKSDQELRAKKIRTKLTFDNGGLFSTSEITFLKGRFGEQIEEIQDGLTRLSRRDSALAERFDEETRSIRNAHRQIDDQIKLITVNRSTVCFPASKRKADQRFAKLTLHEKLLQVADEKLTRFSPDTIHPRIKAHVNRPMQEGANETTIRRLYQVTGDLSEDVQQLILSWNQLLCLRAEEDED